LEFLQGFGRIPLTKIGNAEDVMDTRPLGLGFFGRGAGCRQAAEQQYEDREQSAHDASDKTAREKGCGETGVNLAVIT
jgi:hypothetical protein